MALNQQVIIIAGPTASGKSQLAIDVAMAASGVIVNADSMQVYQDTPILSAVPNEQDKALVEHCLYEVFPSSKNGTVADWLALAIVEIRRIWEQDKIPVVCGGTGLYIDNLINGTTPIPGIEVHIRQQIAQEVEQEGITTLHARLSKIDALSAQRLNPNDSTRVKRAMEVFLQTGIKLSDWHQKPMIKKLPEAVFRVIKILPAQAELDERCARRFEIMINQGALSEVEKLKSLNLDENLPAMKALGVPELMDYLNGNSSLEEAVKLAQIHTRQYAKRQRTWFAQKPKADIVLDECYKGDKSIISELLTIISK